MTVIKQMALCLSFLLLSGRGHAQIPPGDPVMAVHQQSDGVLLTMKGGSLKLQPCGDAVVHVLYSLTTPFLQHPELIVIKPCRADGHWTIQENAVNITLSTSRVRVVVTRTDGSILFTDASGHRLFQDVRRSLIQADVNGEKTRHAEMVASPMESYEAFYGLGQHQSGALNYRGSSVDISQDNTNISVPFVLSSNGYGILWNNTSRSKFNNRFRSTIYVSSEIADVIDYYFVYGPEFDQLIGSYRDLTGAVPLFGKWAYGLWQCKNRYQSQDEIVGVAQKYRDLHIPIDNIVQDWFWWNVMGEPTFDRKRYPNPKTMFYDLHHNHFHVMISVWPFFEPGSKTYDDMDEQGLFIDKAKVGDFLPRGTALYDALSPKARKYYWDLIDKNLFQIGADAWWLDSDEPESVWREDSILVTANTALGNGARYANVFPLMHTSGVYEGQRASSDQKRVFILSRSGFAGQQRNAAAVWSGDIEASWSSFKRQIPAGLNYSMSGLPYWTTDIGGFVTGHPDDAAYRELFVRWFQFGTFNPILRIHGTRDPDQNELWSYGPAAQKILVKFDTLRYRMLPCIS